MQQRKRGRERQFQKSEIEKGRTKDYVSWWSNKPGAFVDLEMDYQLFCSFKDRSNRQKYVSKLILLKNYPFLALVSLDTL